MSEPASGTDITFDDILAMSEELSAPGGGQGPAADDVNSRIIAEFRGNAGRIAGDVGVDNDLVIVTVKGAKSGKDRIIPLVYFDVDGRIVIIASMAGAAKHPTWYINMRANPAVTVEIGADTFAADAVEITGADRDTVFATVCERNPVFQQYQDKTERKIPVVELVHHDWPTTAE